VGAITAVVGIESKAFRPNLSDKFPIRGVTTSAPNPIICTKTGKIK
jgi:hypothetical protein